MNRKILIILMILIAAVSVGAVSASDNVTDVGDEAASIADDSQIDDSSLSQDLQNELEEDDLLMSDESGDVLCENQSSAEVTTSKITASKVVGYTSFSSTVSAVLTSNGTALVSKPVKIILNGVTYNKVTDSNGKVSLNVKLAKGTYTAQFIYAGDNTTSEASKNSTVIFKDAIKTKLKIGDKYLNYRQGSSCLFYVKLLDANGKAIKNQQVFIKVNGKTYNVKTSKNGIAKIYLSLKKGNYKVKYYFKKTSPYLASSGSYKIKVRASMGKGDGYWLWSSHMNSVNLKSLSQKGTKHILLHVHSLAVHGKSAVISFIKKAHKYGMKVHLWMQVCYSGGEWVRPVNKDGSIKYSFLKSKMRLAKKYSQISGVDGIHFDYVRFGGSAHLYKTSAKAISYFVKHASYQIHKVRPNCIVSAAIMPEPSMMLYYYGQDVPTMSRYLDVLLPMVYKGSYHKSSSWIKSVTKTFVGQSNGAQIWTGLQTYHSESNTNKLSHSELLKDAKNAKAGGAKGIFLFRIGISCNFNFKKV